MATQRVTCKDVACLVGARPGECRYRAFVDAFRVPDAVAQSYADTGRMLRRRRVTAWLQLREDGGVVLVCAVHGRVRGRA